MAVTRAHFAGAPLETLFPHATAADRQRMTHAAAVVDAARPPGDEPLWQWFRDHIAFPGTGALGVPEILLTTISVHDQDADWLALELDVEWAAAGALNVCAAVSVACWCEVDHNTHYVDPLDVPVTADVPLGMAFEVAARRLVAWLDGPADPDTWRAYAGLPLR